MLEKIREILVEQLDLDPEEIVESASFRDASIRWIFMTF